jgi:5-methylcytosine-specific restriction endonuclease McrA
MSPGSSCVICRRRIPSGSYCPRHRPTSPSNRAWHEPGAWRTRSKVLERDGGCVICGAIEDLTVHHLISAAEGGTNDADNLAAVCLRHHQAIHRGEIELAKPLP